MKTPTLKSAGVSRSWYIVDASKIPLGRLSTGIATYLIGKHKPNFTPHIDNGDYIIVINADKLIVTGRKMDQKKYYRHSGYMGGIKQTKLADMVNEKPQRVIEKAVKGMLPKNKLQTQRMKRLKVYAGPEHANSAQKPEALDFTNHGGGK